MTPTLKRPPYEADARKILVESARWVRQEIRQSRVEADRLRAEANSERDLDKNGRIGELLAAISAKRQELLELRQEQVRALRKMYRDYREYVTTESIGGGERTRSRAAVGRVPESDLYDDSI